MDPEGIEPSSEIVKTIIFAAPYAVEYRCIRALFIHFRPPLRGSCRMRSGGRLGH